MGREVGRTKKETGKEGEDLAIRYLKKRGFRILERNWRDRFGEIDIIGLDRGTLAFIEVKTRKTTSYGPPPAAVDKRKQKRLHQLATSYIQCKRIEDTPIRFDVIGIELDAQGGKIEHIKDAFDL